MIRRTPRATQSLASDGPVGKPIVKVSILIREPRPGRLSWSSREESAGENATKNALTAGGHGLRAGPEPLEGRGERPRHNRQPHSTSVKQLDQRITRKGTTLSSERIYPGRSNRVNQLADTVDPTREASEPARVWFASDIDPPWRRSPKRSLLINWIAMNQLASSATTPTTRLMVVKNCMKCPFG